MRNPYEHIEEPLWQVFVYLFLMLVFQMHQKLLEDICI